jgi:CHAT domain-containing protein
MAAFNTFNLASDLLSILLKELDSEIAKLSLLKENKTLYAKAIESAAQLGKLTQNRDYYKTALKFAEMGRAIVLEERMQENDALKFSGIPEPLLTQKKSNARYITLLKKNLLKEKKKSIPDKINIDLWQNKLFELNREQENLTAKLNFDYPLYSDTKNKIHVPDITKMLNRIDEKTVLVEYALGETSLTIFVLTEQELNVRQISIDSTFIPLVNNYRKSITNLDIYGFKENSAELYNLLIKPVEKFIHKKKKLIIIPEDVLLTIPFESLLVHKSENMDFTELPFLVKDISISYHLSIKTYFASMRDDYSEKQYRYTAFAPSFFKQPLFNELDNTEKEVDRIIKYLGRNGTSFKGESVTKDVFISEARKSEIIHLATHGIVNEKEPKLSGLVFAKESETDDGILYAGEIYNLDMNADLLVMGSCESGAGKLQTGEGIMGLTRGFIYSGVKNIIYSFWKIDDETTLKLMEEFYKEMKTEFDYSNSLRAAKLELIRNPQTAFPLNWAGFVILGY